MTNPRVVRPRRITTISLRTLTTPGIRATTSAGDGALLILPDPPEPRRGEDVPAGSLLAGQGAVQAVVVGKLASGSPRSTCFGYIWCGASVNADHLTDGHGLDRPTADWSFIGFPTSLLSVRRSHTDFNPAC